MKSSITKNTYRAMYRLLDRVSPVKYDCGTMCGAACCTCESEINVQDKQGEQDCNADFSMGLYLLPGEHKMFTGEEDWLSWGWTQADEYEFPDSWHGKVYFLQCTKAPHCDRKNRPIQCRTFPLAPHITEDGSLWLIYQKGELPYKCPLIEDRIELEEDFLRATYTVWKRLIDDPLIYDLVELDSIDREEDGVEIEFVYP